MAHFNHEHALTAMITAMLRSSSLLHFVNQARVSEMREERRQHRHARQRFGIDARTYAPNGARETARRRRQIAAGQLKRENT